MIAVQDSDVIIPDNPPERNYACPGCKKGVRTVRVGKSSQYIVYSAADNKEHNHSGCKYKGPIELKYLL